MDKTDGTARRARDFADAVVCLVSETLLTVQAIDEEEPPSRGISRALAEADAATQRLEKLALGGAQSDDMAEAYTCAAWALGAAATALSELRETHRNRWRLLAGFEGPGDVLVVPR